MEQNSIFRKKSIDRISSPEQLNDYIKVSNPGVWMILISTIFILIGVCVWGIVGHLDTRISTIATVTNGKIEVYVSEYDVKKISKDMPVKIGNDTCYIKDWPKEPVKATSILDEYEMHRMKIDSNSWVFLVELKGELEDGSYDANIIIDRVKPISFIFG